MMFCMCMCVRACTGVCACAPVLACVCAHVCECVRVYACLRVCLRACMYIGVRLYVRVLNVLSVHICFSQTGLCVEVPCHAVEHTIAVQRRCFGGGRPLSYSQG